MKPTRWPDVFELPPERDPRMFAGEWPRHDLGAEVILHDCPDKRFECPRCGGEGKCILAVRFPPRGGSTRRCLEALEALTPVGGDPRVAILAHEVTPYRRAPVFSLRDLDYGGGNPFRGRPGLDILVDGYVDFGAARRLFMESRARTLTLF